MTEPTDNNAGFGSYITGFTLNDRSHMPELSFQSYIRLVEPLAKEVEDETGIIHFVPLVQSSLESRAGNSQLAKEYGNLFGFKATDWWKKQGRPVANLPTWEIVNTDNPDKYKDFTPTVIEKYMDSGKQIYKLKIVVKEPFRIYDTWRDSFFDWGRLISTAKVYADAYKLLRRRETVREGVEKMALVYATDHKYATKLLQLYDKVDYGVA